MDSSAAQLTKASPVSNGGRGLKPRHVASGRGGPGFARQQWRAWIETTSCGKRPRRACASPVSNGGRGLKLGRVGGRARGDIASPVSNGGRGLKPCRLRHDLRDGGFARQQWRAWIETSNGCMPWARSTASPVSNGGRGLKLFVPDDQRAKTVLRPSAMAGVD